MHVKLNTYSKFIDVCKSEQNPNTHIQRTQCAFQRGKTAQLVTVQTHNMQIHSHTKEAQEGKVNSSDGQGPELRGAFTEKTIRRMTDGHMSARCQSSAVVCRGLSTGLEIRLSQLQVTHQHTYAQNTPWLDFLWNNQSMRVRRIWREGRWAEGERERGERNVGFEGQMTVGGGVEGLWRGKEKPEFAS